ncbi:oxidoreductase [Brenneria goodwinii]|uniref:Oxidoreductase n=1 Tax=Brenneria goodwinii TaxID=1109412 RepID=A0AAE8EPZ1_9GAMM|nr:Gfo/Idh/MocA family oxidoreductase [Brenneria goodwinii]ATA23353.1 oxidoreductase [Brenneria goodwinii]MCG8157213.1 Gfo/Idh/MocA family oxidoreductase [Brenneria goodwinii]MCG8163647.1 Gfo/Idh/MocA family oxidoreductase [Brenneria goodwinii]MCG8166097.1 Gfo/Idh/MocA family oxidoreductase [Brenneria goodwinii]MCG8170724.1 Gfo/Idh/MocA family oxidoreductase [Brenneria goodwinii]
MIYGDKKIERPLRWAMVGGGGTSQIGYIHRSAALRDFYFELVAGALDINPERGKAFGNKLHIANDRCYPDYQTMFEKEQQRPDGIEVVTIATPNGTHYEICKAALNAGLHVVCEKPLCFTTKEAEELVALAKSKNKVVGVTYGYAGHQLIEQARQMIAAGDLGEIRIVNMQFAHGAHNVAVEKNAESTRWRVDPKMAGPSYVLGDVGTHPYYLSEVLLPNLKIKRLMCARQSFVKSRAPLEDNAYTLMEYDNGAVGMAWSCCVNSGSMHGQKIRVIGEKASLEWWDERPNQLLYEVQGEPIRIFDRGMDCLYPSAREEDRIGGGHPEGLFEAWSNLYGRFARAMVAADKHETVDYWYPDVHAGLEGVRWVENCVRSADNGAVWIDYR